MYCRILSGLTVCTIVFYLLLMIPLPVLAAARSFTETATGMEFVWVPGGSFQMGQTAPETKILVKAMGEDKFAKYCLSELPCHQVRVDGFWMSKYEVTNGQYRCYKANHDSKAFRGHSLNDDKQPVVEVTFDDAAQYAAWLTKKSGMACRLPTEAEWEYACRAGTTTVCFWGDDSELACAYANVGDLSAKKEWPVWITHECDDGAVVTAPVGSFMPNAFGLYDMLGNVWE
ncbi:MAG: formylglycine-generating enzyme family protein [Deltaproteobacteria bacterium]|nr:formylglycine-generating enzyme family protein [Deltaproteobacteria bacterium]